MPRFPSLQFTEEQVLGALNDARGNQRRAAQALGVTQGWVTKWLKKNGYVQRVTWVKEDKKS
jgi:DNA-binding protein Fis